MEKCLLQSLIIRNDLEEAKSEIEAKGLIRSIAHIKTAFLAFQNLCELEKTIRSLYKDHRELSTKFDAFRPQAEFFSYLRNKSTGHLIDDLIDKAFEWHPILTLTLNKEYDAKLVLIYNFLVLETAINTYVDESGKHKVFESETDLAYPPDNERFQKTLLESIELASDFLSSVEGILKSGVSLPTSKEDEMELLMKASRTVFAYLTKSRR